MSVAAVSVSCSRPGYTGCRFIFECEEHLRCEEIRSASSKICTVPFRSGFHSAGRYLRPYPGCARDGQLCKDPHSKISIPLSNNRRIQPKNGSPHSGNQFPSDKPIISSAIDFLDVPIPAVPCRPISSIPTDAPCRTDRMRRQDSRATFYTLSIVLRRQRIRLSVDNCQVFFTC